ncbi:cytochrome b-c1 complex subunit 9-like [Ceratina calcarata]|uniref:Complex III subunit 9 n=1 Tax=Ceratina calcarata TaxID=156304 RepID=A0AAJ7S995_9HYME|nr:cytochrome b-c1 complex subunit 9-like [Ceratina calcarata]
MANALYNIIFKRSSTFVLAILATSFIFERGLDVVTDSIFDSVNRGKQWKDIKHLYEEK